ncbi:MAG: phospho-N-acetylmuramoyl-pentapeptide-transferase [Alphaproteobacteria bacterium]|nr:phospho-N-acetylmuramoyl-pentapeptide-transferase [Alphaproteobacteria bacterium]
MTILIGLFLLAFLMTLIIGVPVLHWLRYRFNAVNTIREDVPDNHQAKQGTPAMGGLMFLAPCGLVMGFVFLLVWRHSFDTAFPVWVNVATILFVVLGCALLGFVDDAKKYWRWGKRRGLSGRARLVVQALLAGGASLIATQYGTLDTTVSLGFGLGFGVDLAWWGHALFTALVVMATANAVNLTDGLDGLAAGCGGIALVGLVLLLLVVGLVGHPDLADTATLEGVVSGQTHAMLGVFVQFMAPVLPAIVLAGGLFGFLWYNAHPAQVFMGDTGSLAIGGMIGITTIMIDAALPLIVVGIVFVIETLSVIVQVFCFQRLGFRPFLITPIHHHFERKGVPETRIVMRFWLISLGASALMIGVIAGAAA